MKWRTWHRSGKLLRNIRQSKHHPNGESGSITAMCLIFFVMMLTVCGLAVDFIRTETLRTTLQNTTDRALLAATKLDQTLDPEEVIRDYFDKQGLAQYIKAVEVSKDTEAARVMSIDAEIEAKTLFMQLTGTDMITISTSARAEDYRSNLEISLVLDVSTSMARNGGGSRTRIESLRIAAQEFIDTIYEEKEHLPDNEYLTTVSIVPYNSNVNIGPTLANYYNLQKHHPYSLCPTLFETSYTTTEIDPNQALGIASHIQLAYGRQYPDGPISHPECPTNPMTRNQIEPFISDAEQAKTVIRSLGAFGGTAIDLGLKWGVALLDPASRPVTAKLAGAGHVDDDVADRPYDYSDDAHSMKMVVLMSDGENTTRDYITEPYKSGMSDIWVYRETPDQPLHEVPLDRFSLKVGEDQFFRLGQRNVPTNCTNGIEAEPDSRIILLPAPYAGDDTSGASAERVSWPELYATWSTKKIGLRMFQIAVGACLISQSYANEHRTFEDIGYSQADTRLFNLCDAAKAEGIIIFSVAFEAPEDGEEVLAECASSDAHYFDVDGTTIADAFASIAQTIQLLKLTQ